MSLINKKKELQRVQSKKSIKRTEKSIMNLRTLQGSFDRHFFRVKWGTEK